MRDGVDPAYVLELAEQLEADLDEPLRNLSTGNRQKIGVINSLMHKPELVVLDEPASGLDPLIRRRLYKLLSDVRIRDGAVLLSSHVLPEVERICDRVGIIRNGQLALVSSIADLRSDAVRRLDIVFSHAPPIEELRKVGGVVSVEAENSSVHVTVSGSLSELVKAIAKYEVVDLSSSGQVLEDQFMSYYDGPQKPEQAGDL
jgi:ABC-2 type transport system ATP-binding protein